jgi:hypothetical protein
MPDVDVRPGVDAGAGKGPGEGRRVIAALAFGNVEVVRHDDEVGHGHRLVHRSQIPLEVALMARAHDLEAATVDEHDAGARRLIARKAHPDLARLRGERAASADVERG